MSDRKHMEYCIRLGNPWVQEKLDRINQGTYIENQAMQNEMQKEEVGKFRNNLRNWNS